MLGRKPQIDYRLVQRIELVQEALIWYDGTLGDVCRAVGVICALLQDPVPMLQRGITSLFLGIIQQRKFSYDRCGQVHGWVFQQINDSDGEFVALCRMWSVPGS